MSLSKAEQVAEREIYFPFHAFIKDFMPYYECSALRGNHQVRKLQPLTNVYKANCLTANSIQ